MDTTKHTFERVSGKLVFRGTLEGLQDLALLTGNGEWQAKPNGVWRFVAEDGAGLNWSSTRGTVWFDGPHRAQERLRLQLKRPLLDGGADYSTRQKMPRPAEGPTRGHCPPVMRFSSGRWRTEPCVKAPASS